MLNICAIAEQVQRVTGVEFEVVGFDSGEGLPPPRDFRDHPELYSAGDYPMTDRGALMSRLPGYAKIYFGNVAERVEAFLAEQKSTIGFVAFDLDYYWSTAAALKIFEAPADCYLPKVVCYFDDVGFDWHNAYAGELLAINEFNTAHEWRKITPYNFLGKERIFTRAKWIERMYLGHIFDHSFRSPHSQKVQQARVLSNPYLGG